MIQLNDEEAEMRMVVDGTTGCLCAFAQLKLVYPHLNLILSIGGGGKGSETLAFGRFEEQCKGKPEGKVFQTECSPRNIDATCFDTTRARECKYRLVVSSVPKGHPVCVQTSRDTNNLMSHTDAKYRSIPFL